MPRRRRTRWFVVAVTLAVVSAVAWVAGDRDSAGLSGILYFVVLATTLAPRGARGVTTSGGALVLRNALGRGALGGLTFAAFVTLSWTWPEPFRTVALAAAAVLLAGAALQVLRGDGEVRIDANGVSQRRWRRHMRVAWDDVLRPRAGWVDTIVLDTGGDDEHVVVANGLAADPHLVYWTLRYYAEHPESRDELADSRAVERVRRGDVVPEPVGVG